MKQLTLAVSKPFTNFIKHLFIRQVSSFLIIFGRRGSGKTDISLLIAEILDYLGLINHIATNIKIYESQFSIEHITSLQDLRLWCKQTKGKKLFIFDEVGKAIRRRTPMASLNVKLIDELQILRKYKLSIIMITPNEKYVDRTTLGSDVLDGYFIKPRFDNPKVALYYDLLESFDKKLFGIPRTSIKFDTWDSAPFTQFSTKTPRFKDKDMQMAWRWLHGSKIEDLGIQAVQLHRIQRKILKEYFELKDYTLQDKGSEVI